MAKAKKVLSFFGKKIPLTATNIAIFCIFIVAIALRFYNFPNRWGLGSDDMRDVAIAKEAIERGELPLYGSFSSAGPFVFGPLFYWFLMLCYLIFPFSLVTPWVVNALIGVVTVGVVAFTAKRIGGMRFATIAALVVALSPQFVARSTALSQHIFVGICSTLLVLFFVLLWQKKQSRYAFLMGLSLGVALSMHYQAINLFIFFPVLLFIPKLSLREKLLRLGFMMVGFLLPSLPLLWWDFQQSFANIKNILDYLLIAQYRIYVANSWKLFLFQYFPQYWSHVIGGYTLVGLLLMFLTGITWVVATVRKKIPSEIFVLGLIFSFLILLNRYYRGERYDGYMIYFSPFIFLLSSWAFSDLFRFAAAHRIKLLMVCVVFSVGVFGSLFGSIQLLSGMHNNIEEFENIQKILFAKYPGEKFAVYDNEWKNSNESYPLSLFLREKQKYAKEGLPIGLTEKPFIYRRDRIVGNIRNSSVVTLKKDDIADKKTWIYVSQERIYEDLMQWMKGKKLTSTFSLTDYLFR